VLSVAASGGGDAAVGVGASDEFDAGHDAGAYGAGGFEKQPGNGGRFGGGALLKDFAFDGAAVV